ncbi:hypothetical protein GCM10019016_026020 [Streptomyces prasinosporus]|uniref:Uncharacterized protein n=1 Tax=Streptomyces prasinosporus TaxID=68256 RepID=A0ABP6TJU8_9ACTN|nr:hypothetical protein GCM10010332_29300 [Streptomyces albogriseolus]
MPAGFGPGTGGDPDGTPPTRLPEGPAMVVLALLVPSLMLGVILMLGRYEDFVLPPREAEPEPGDRPAGGLSR